MPIYEYRCLDCDKKFEVLKLPGREEITECNNCGSLYVRKLISECNHKIKGYCHKNEYDGKKKAMADPPGWGEFGDG